MRSIYGSTYFDWWWSNLFDKNKKYVFVFDNGPAHKAKISKEYLYSLGKNIFIEFLPPYSPQLNCIETCWKIISTMLQTQIGLKQLKT
ncbi:MAG: transposase [Candidatus Woesearchaeota archaeon]